MQSLIAAQPAALAGTSRRGCRAAVAQKAPSLRPSCAGSPQLHYGRRPTRTAATCDSIGSATSQPPLPLPPRAAPDSAALALLAGFEEDLDGAGSKQLRNFCEVAYLSGRSHLVCQHFPGALGADDFMARLEIALYAYGFSGDNSIKPAPLRLHPVCPCCLPAHLTLSHETVAGFPLDFNTHGEPVPGRGHRHPEAKDRLGVWIGLQHKRAGGRGDLRSQRGGGGAQPRPRVPRLRQGALPLLLFPTHQHRRARQRGRHLAPRPPRRGLRLRRPQQGAGRHSQGRAGQQLQDPGGARRPGPRVLHFEAAHRTPPALRGGLRGDGLPAEPGDVTQVAERTITDDLQHLISETVDPRRADYAVVTGVQVHSWGGQFDDDSPNLEFVAPTSVYVVVNGEKAHLDLSALPSLTPRQVALLARQGEGEAGGGRGREDGVVCNQGGHGTVREMDPPYLYNSRETKRRERARADTYAALLAEEVLQPQLSCAWPSWQSRLLSGEAHRGEGDTSVVIDHSFESDDELDGMWAKLQNKYLDLSGAMPDQGQVQSTEGGSGGSGGSSGASPPPPPTSHVSNSSARTSLAVSPPAAAGAGAPAAAAAAGTASGAEGGEAPPRMGLLARLLRTVSAGKQRRRQGREGKSE